MGTLAARRRAGNWPLERGGNTGYTRAMAKVMISLPDDLLRAIDREAERRSTTRSGYIRSLVEDEFAQRSRARAAGIAELRKRDGGPTPHGGNVAELVKANRPN